ncbi:MAG TPA: chromosome segregation protein SMC [Gammaproteobacteria bacterium]|nr:chromosome segregation protein SMC [Gammaproteobacteria bacterium]
MRLKCIKLAGFKTFVDPTTINFPSSLCAVVGPNGCGKSNVIDAVRWVMGESSAKNLRGEQMTDVIFNGSSSRKPVGQASVELVFDNHDKKLRGEYVNFAEVSIKRKVDRDAQSTYSLNGIRCRRKDITDIFLGTGLGARSYSIIEQGMVSRLIESKPEELRIFIEEAAGISKYKERRKETENRIRRTRDNLERLTDIRDELERQLQHLKRQSVAAEKYGEFKQQERQTTANLNALRWRSLDDELRSNQESINSLEINIEATTAEQRKLDARVEKHLSDNSDLTDALGEVQEHFYSLGNDIALIEQSIEHHIERIDQLRLDFSETEEGRSQTKEELDVDLKKITQLDAELRLISPELEAATNSEAESTKLLENAEQKLQQWQQEWDAFNQRAEEPRQSAEVEQSRIQQLEKIVDRGLERKQNLEQEQQAIAASPEDESITETTRQINKLEADIGSGQARNTKLGLQLENRRQALATNSTDLDAVRSELQTARGKLASLEALQQAALGQDQQEINRWLRQKGMDNQLRLGESLKIAAGWEMAVETVLGDSLQSICVEGLGNLGSLLAELPQGKLGLIDVLTVAPGSEAANANAELTLLATKVSCDWDLGDLLADIYVADNLADALASRDQLTAGESIITANGVWLGTSWIQIYTENKQNSVVERRSLISEISINIKYLNNKSNKLIEQQERLKSALSKDESAREATQTEISKNSRELSDLKSLISASMAKVEEANLRAQRLQRELEELARQLTLEEENTAEARARLQQALDDMERDIGDRERLEANRDETREALEKCRANAATDKDLVHELALKQQSTQSQLQSTRETMDRMASQMQRSKERMESLHTQLAESDEPVQTMRKDLESLLQKRLTVEKELTAAKAKVDDNEHSIRSLEQQRNQKLEQLNTVRESLMQMRLKNEGASVKREGILEQLQAAKFDLEVVLAELPDGMEQQECEQKLEKLGNRIQRLGPINLAAIDEYKQGSERKVYLDKQNEDLEKALNTLQNAIRKIDKETRARFKETFDKINSGLQKLFPKVFGGGHAYLDMTGDDLLDTGVAIMARPPGKRNSTIHLLSGGEKAMTAIALVFSIFQLNPSPFCILDEVDAPLDDANVERYAKLVREMAANVQFIFITHNKLTMEMANQLLGVTMHEPGVSRVVAVDIDAAAELAAI